MASFDTTHTIQLSHLWLTTLAFTPHYVLTSITSIYHVVINLKYTTTIDCAGSIYLGMSLKWYYTQIYVDIYIPGYIEHAPDLFKITASYCSHHYMYACDPIH